MILTNSDKKLLALFIEKPWKEPVHGPCCMCQICGNWHEDCYCDEWDTYDAIHQLEVGMRVHKMADTYVRRLMRLLDLKLSDWDTQVVTDNRESPMVLMVTAPLEKRLIAARQTIESERWLGHPHEGKSDSVI